MENLALSEISRFFINHGLQCNIYFVRSKEQVEIDFLVELSHQRWIAIEVQATPVDLSREQTVLLESLQLNIVEKWVVSTTRSTDFAHARVVLIDEIFEHLEKFL